MATKYDFDLDQGTDFEIELTFYDDSDTAEDLTARTFTGMARQKFLDAAPAFSFSFEIKDQTGADKGKLIVRISDADTSALALKENTKYIYDIEETVSTKTQRILEGIITVRPAATK